MRGSSAGAVLVGLLVGLASPAVGAAAGAECAPRAPTNVVLVVGDGMGVGVVSAGLVARAEMALRRLDHTGLVLPWPAGEAVLTDSAAAATALATGRPAPNGVISVDAEGEPLPTLLERAERRGLRTGIVVTSQVTHATPAAFAAHARSRRQVWDIAEQIAASGVDVLIGGGRDDFLPVDSGGTRPDGRDLLAEMWAGGYEVVDAAFLATPESGPERVVGLLAAAALPSAGDRDPPFAALVFYALEVLEPHDAGYVLIVEGSQIDWAGHRRVPEWLLAEVLDLDDVVRTVLDRVDLTETLVVVVADHDTGGYAPVGGSRVSGTVAAGFIPEVGHTGSLVPIFASGPAAACFAGISTIAEVGARLHELVERGGAVGRARETAAGPAEGGGGRELGE